MERWRYLHGGHVLGREDVGGVGDEETRLPDGTVAHHRQLQRACRRRLHGPGALQLDPRRLGHTFPIVAFIGGWRLYRRLAALSRAAAGQRPLGRQRLSRPPPPVLATCRARGELNTPFLHPRLFFEGFFWFFVFFVELVNHCKLMMITPGLNEDLWTGMM